MTRRTVIKPHEHPTLGPHMEIFALFDLEPFVECLTPYGESWWVSKGTEALVLDQHILSMDEYHVLHKQYQEALMKLYA